LWSSRQLWAIRAVTLRTVGRLAALGAVFTLGVVVLGAQLQRWAFGQRYEIGRLSMLVLSLSCVAYMVASSMAQTLVAVGRARSAALGWLFAVLAFATIMLTRTGVELRVSVAMLVGAGIAAAVHGAALAATLRSTGARDE
jgi:O-antigen/teichoic acid export membrane protein